ncbi:MAG: tetratricopeptide repeat protein [Pirellulaceae bacterium]
MKKPSTVIAAILIAALVVLSLLAVFGKPPELWLTADQQGDRLFAQEQYVEAAEVYEDPLRKGAALYRSKDFERAAAAFARVDNAESAFNRGNSLMLLGKYDEAITSFDRAMQFEPEWREAQENRGLAIARRDKLKPPEDDAGGTGGQLGADEIVFDDRAKNASQTQEIEAGSGEQMSDESLRELWLQRVQTKPADFLRIKFAYQLAKQEGAAE